MVDNTYDRLIKTTIAEKIMNKSFVNFDMGYFSTVFNDKRNSREKLDPEFVKFYKYAKDGSGIVSTKYNSKNKVTARMFTEKGFPNFITLSNNEVIRSIKSRYNKSGCFALMDYSNFEYKIIRKILKLNDFPDDFHNESALLLGVDRDIVKKLNNMVFYGEINNNWKNNLSKYLSKTSEENLKKYLYYIKEIKSSTRDLLTEKNKEYETNGFVLNYYGRKIYPNNQKDIFNNIVQSTGSEILIDAIINIDNYIANKNIHFMFHRFDSIFFDCEIEQLKKDLETIISLMELACETIPQSVKTKVGKSLLNMKEIT